VGFPQYGFKADLSGDAFRSVALFKPAPGICNATDRLPSPFVSSENETWTPVLSRAGLLFVIPSLGPHGLTPEVLAPVRVILSLSINTY